MEMLPAKLNDLAVPPTHSGTLPKNVKTIADLIICTTEEAISSHRTTASLNSEARINPANVQTAIRRLREALKPYVRGWVDSETANIVPAALDTKLAARAEVIAKMRLPSAPLRALTMLCHLIELSVSQWATANGETVREKEMLRYINSALTFASIKHPNITKHRDRLAALVFPKDVPPPSQG